MSVKDNYNKRITFNTQGRLEDKIDKLTAMMGKLVARDSEVNRPFKPQVYQVREEDKVGMFITHIIMTGGIITINIDQKVGIGEFN